MMIQCSKHNNTYDGVDYYLSYNFGDRYIYGSDTTAIVIGQMQRFYILDGYHVDNLKGKSFNEVIEYYLSNSDKINKMSNKYCRQDALNIIQSYKEFKLKHGYK